MKSSDEKKVMTFKLITLAYAGPEIMLPDKEERYQLLRNWTKANARQELEAQRVATGFYEH